MVGRAARSGLSVGFSELLILALHLSRAAAGNQQDPWFWPRLLRLQAGAQIQTFQPEVGRMGLGRSERISCRTGAWEHCGGIAVLHDPTMAAALVDAGLGAVHGIIHSAGATGAGRAVSDLL